MDSLLKGIVHRILLSEMSLPKVDLPMENVLPNIRIREIGEEKTPLNDNAKAPSKRARKFGVTSSGVVRLVQELSRK